MKNNEQRRVHRIEVELPSKFLITDVEMKAVKADIKDISAIGLCFVTKQEVQPGHKIDIHVQLPDGTEALIQGEVKWVKSKVVYEVAEHTIGVHINDTFRKEEEKFVRFFAKRFLAAYSRKNMK